MTPARQAARGNLRVGAYYALGAAAALALAVVPAWRPFALVLLWPALSAMVAAAGYLLLGPAVYRKHGGRLPWPLRALMAPVLLGQWLSLRHYRRKAAPWSVLTPSLVIGSRLDEDEASAMVAGGVTAVLDLTAELPEALPFLAVTYRNIPVLDLTAPAPAQLASAIEFLREETAKGKVYVHCKIGYSRTAAIVGAYLLVTGACATAEEAVGLLRRARPSIVVRPEAWAAIRAHERG